MTILATGMEDDLSNEVKKEVHHDEDDYYESLIPGLYKPEKVTVGQVIATQTVIDFDSVEAPETEVADSDYKSEDYMVADYKSTTTDGGEEELHEPTALDTLKNWLKKVMKDVSE